MTWDEYLSVNDNETLPHLGRKPMYKSSTKYFKGTVAMSEDFPMTVEVLMDVLEVIAPFKHFSKLREFMLTRLPPGFPVKIEVPVFPTVSAKITFHSFAYSKSIPSNLFKVPREYTEDPNRFPDLWHFLESTLIHVLLSQRCIGEVPQDQGKEPLVGLDVPLSNLGGASADMTLVF